MLLGINVALITAIAVTLVLFLLRRRTRIITTQLVESPWRDLQESR